MLDFGLRLKQLRESKGLSQIDVAKKIHKSKSIISGYENNIRMPPVDVLVDLALIFNVSLDYIIGIEKKEMISIDNLNDNQKDLISSLILEFESLN